MSESREDFDLRVHQKSHCMSLDEIREIISMCQEYFERDKLQYNDVLDDARDMIYEKLKYNSCHCESIVRNTLEALKD